MQPGTKISFGINKVLILSYLILSYLNLSKNTDTPAEPFPAIPPIERRAFNSPLSLAPSADPNSVQVFLTGGANGASLLGLTYRSIPDMC